MVWLKRALGYILIIGSTVVAVALLTGYGYLYKGIKEVWLRGWSSGNIDDLKYAYDTRVLTASEPIPWPEDMRVDEILGDTIKKWMEEELTASFLVVHRDTVIFEKYWRGHNQSTLTNSFSMAKTIVAMALGKAVDDGLVDVQKPLYTYIPRFKDDLGSSVTVEHVLQMRTCIPFGESYSNPFGFPARAYYGRDIQGLIEPYRPEAPSGTKFHYQSGNTILLAEILANVQEKSIAQYVSDNIWSPIHAERNAEWGLDGVNGLERSFAAFYATTRDFARLGNLLLDFGKVDSTQVISEEYVKKMVTPVSDNELGVDIPFYGYQIWLGNTDDGLGFYFLRGHRGQYVLSVPKKDLIMVRTGYQSDRNLIRNISVDTYIYLEAALKIAEQREQL